MLTATYSLVAIAAEQKTTYSILAKLKQYIQGTLDGRQSVDPAALESAIDRLAQFDIYCHSRKVEVYVIPALRSSTEDVDQLLTELESLSAAARRILASLQQRIERAIQWGTAEVNQMCLAMEQYCDKMFRRLAKEEQQLLPVVNQLLSNEEWFSLGAQFLSDDGDRYGHRRVPPPAIPRIAVPM